MLIETFILCNNEELLMPYLMRHYSQYGKVIILESNSTDKTVEIAQSMGAEVWSYEVPDEINDDWFTKLKNNCWKESKAEWVIIVDADEFVYYPGLISELRRNRAHVIQPRFYNMYSEKFPTTNGQIYEEVTMGIEQTSPKAKMNIFRPRIKDINYLAGCHEAFPDARIDIDSPIKTLHMRNLGRNFIIERNLRARRRNSELNRQNGWGCHVDWPEEKWIEDYEQGLRNATKVT